MDSIGTPVGPMIAVPINRVMRGGARHYTRGRVCSPGMRSREGTSLSVPARYRHDLALRSLAADEESQTESNQFEARLWFDRCHTATGSGVFCGLSAFAAFCRLMSAFVGFSCGVKNSGQTRNIRECNLLDINGCTAWCRLNSLRFA